MFQMQHELWNNRYSDLNREIDFEINRENVCKMLDIHSGFFKSLRVTSVTVKNNGWDSCVAMAINILNISKKMFGIETPIDQIDEKFKNILVKYRSFLNEIVNPQNKIYQQLKKITYYNGYSMSSKDNTFCTVIAMNQLWYVSPVVIGEIYNSSIETFSKSTQPDKISCMAQHYYTKVDEIQKKINQMKISFTNKLHKIYSKYMLTMPVNFGEMGAHKLKYFIKFINCVIDCMENMINENVFPIYICILKIYEQIGVPIIDNEIRITGKIFLV